MDEVESQEAAGAGPAADQCGRWSAMWLAAQTPLGPAGMQPLVTCFPQIIAVWGNEAQKPEPLTTLLLAPGPSELGSGTANFLAPHLQPSTEREGILGTWKSCRVSLQIQGERLA